MDVDAFDYDLIILGSGPGGEGAAMQAAKTSSKVAVIDAHSAVGGNCTHVATIPSKALRQVAHQLVSFETDPICGKYFDRSQVRFSDLLFNAKKVIEKQVSMRTSHYIRNGVDLFCGRGRFIDAHTISIDQEDGQKTTLRAKHFVIATGARPYIPGALELDSERVFSSDTVLALEHLPRTITVYGAGVVGCEYTCIFRSLGRKVNLINSEARLLDFLDNEISEALSYHLRDNGVLIRNGEALEKVEKVEDGVIVHCRSGKKIKSDILLYTCGRQGNSNNLGLEDLGIEIDRRGAIVVNEHYQTTAPHIYAVGDVTGFPSLASAAYDQGRFASRHIKDNHCDNKLIKDIPVGIYTSPEISCVGKTEKDLTEANIPYEIGHASFRHLAKAQISGQTVGMLKILFHAHTLEILGVHCFGHNASEIIHIGQVVMLQPAPQNTLRYFIDTTFNYPTMAEAYRVAALNGLNRVWKA